MTFFVSQAIWANFAKLKSFCTHVAKAAAEAESTAKMVRKKLKKGDRSLLKKLNYDLEVAREDTGKVAYNAFKALEMAIAGVKAGNKQKASAGLEKYAKVLWGRYNSQGCKGQTFNY